MTNIDFDDLPRTTREILIGTGISDSLVDLTRFAGQAAPDLYRTSIPALHETFGRDIVVKRWGEFIKEDDFF